jgi:hypothetical protein
MFAVAVPAVPAQLMKPPHADTVQATAGSVDTCGATDTVFEVPPPPPVAVVVDKPCATTNAMQAQYTITVRNDMFWLQLIEQSLSFPITNFIIILNRGGAAVVFVKFNWDNVFFDTRHPRSRYDLCTD